MPDTGARSGDTAERGLFAPRTPLLIAIIGIAMFAGWLGLSAFGADFRSGRDGGAHGLSVGATGYAGVVALVHAIRPAAYVARDRADVIAAGLAILTPDTGMTKPEELAAIIRQRGARPTLVILPKWLTFADPLHPGWVKTVGTAPVTAMDAQMGAASPFVLLEVAEQPGRARLYASTPLRLPQPDFAGPQRLRVLQRSAAILPVIATADGRSVLGRIGSNLYVLADPDLVANHSLGDPARARLAAQLITALAPAEGAIAFDTTLNGFGGQHSLAQLALQPPFLGLTLCLAAAALLAGWAAVPRFGTSPVPPRALAFGKRALIDNAAALIRIARRQPAAAVRYVEMTIDDAATRARLASSDRGALIQRLDRRRSLSPPLADLAAAATAATSPASALAAAIELHRWKEDVTREFG